MRPDLERMVTVADSMVTPQDDESLCESLSRQYSSRIKTRKPRVVLQ
ncbi:MAG: hypothetical protein R3C24_00415 [Cyanobacteriota/Melainabacteria group bacterium]